MKKLQPVFDTLRKRGLFKDATIIVHGDHGSKLFRNGVSYENLENLETQDYLDGFSTLFAMKRGDLHAGVNQKTLSLSELFEHVVMQDGKSGDRLLPDRYPVVFLKDHGGPGKSPKYVPVPMPYVPGQEDE